MNKSYPSRMLEEFRLFGQGDTSPAVWVWVTDQVTEAELATFKTKMMNYSCLNGMVIDPNRIHILRDEVDEVDADPSSIKVDQELETEKLLASDPSRPLDQRVEEWLKRLSHNWRATLPKEEWAKVLLMDIVPAVVATTVERVYRQ
jgi:hypothetical protein